MFNEINQEELVVLVDEDDNPIGTRLKDEVHTDKTPLHRGFSCFVFNDRGEVLVTQRSLNKKTWPGVWSNSFCGHPMPGESRVAALHRRAAFELGMKVKEVQKVADYSYRFEREGIVEHEVCPIYTAKSASDINPNPDEIGGYEWMKWRTWLDVLRRDNAGEWTEWCKAEALIVNQSMNS